MVAAKEKEMDFVEEIRGLIIARVKKMERRELAALVLLLGDNEVSEVLKTVPDAKNYPPSDLVNNEPPKKRGSRRRRRKSKMSAAQRKAVSERMKKYWAARRKAKG